MRAEPLTLSIEPLRTYLSLKTGDRWSSTMRVTNQNTHAVAYELRIVGMNADGSLIDFTRSTGTEITTEISGQRNRSFANWITVEPTHFTVAKGQTKTLPVTITVPATAEPGDYRVLVLLGTERGEIPGNVAEVQSYVASAFRMQVEGAIVERGALTEVSVPAHWLVTQYPEVTVRFSNTGNVALNPKGQMSFMKETFNRTYVQLEHRIELPTISPNKTSKITITPEAGNEFGFGHYTAEVRLSYGTEHSQSVESSVSFWVVTPVVLFSIAGIGLVTVLIMSFMLLLRLYERHRHKQRSLHY